MERWSASQSFQEKRESKFEWYSIELCVGTHFAVAHINHSNVLYFCTHRLSDGAGLYTLQICLCHAHDFT
jgi:hypothetical protein